MGTLYFAETSFLENQEILDAEFEKIHPIRKERMTGVCAKTKRERLAVEWLLSQVLFRYGVESKDIYYSDRGKPMMDKLCLSIAHNKDAVCVAVSDFPVGADIQWLQKTPIYVIKKFFPREQEFVLQSEYKSYELLRFWTGKESYLKMTGEGLSGLSRTEVFLDEGKVHYAGEETDCFLQSFFCKRYVMSVCGERDFSLEEIEYGKNF